MADDHRRDDDRNRANFYDRETWRGGPGGGQQGESFRQGADRDRASGQMGGQDARHGQSYGQAGGYNPGPGRSYGGFQGSQAGGAYPQGQGGYGQQAQGQQSYGAGYGPESYGQGGPGVGGGYGGATTGFAGGQGYTGQTGTGYGRTQGGSPGRDDDPSLWDKARHAVSGVFGGGDRPEGSHRGRGPKNYSRSDDRIRDDVNDRLTDDPFLDATHIEASVEAGEVTLTGTVTNRADKRRAEDLADNVSGAKHVQNNLRVQEVGEETSR